MIKAVIALVLVGWVINTPWLIFLIVGATLTALAYFAWAFARAIPDMRSPPRSWTRTEPKFEWTAKPSWDSNYVNEGANGRNRSTNANTSEGVAEKALAARIAELLDETKAQEAQLLKLRNHINKLELEIASAVTRVHDAVNVGRDEVLHAFGHRRDEFERMLREFMQKEQAQAQRDQSRREEQQRQERRRQEEAAHQRKEQARRHARPSRPWWEVLGVSPDASEGAVRQAYRTLAKNWHPDNRVTGDPERMAEINAAKDEAMKRFARAA